MSPRNYIPRPPWSHVSDTPAPDHAFFVVVGFAVVAVLLTWWYFRRIRISRPPIGVLNIRDVALMILLIVLVPYLYLAVPPWLAATLLGLGLFSILQVTLESLLPGRWLSWIATLVLLSADVMAALLFGARSAQLLLANNIVLTIGIIGAANLWAQSGMRARDAAVLAAALTVYDFVATSVLSVMNDLVDRQTVLPFAPLLAWPSVNNEWLGIGLGDLLLVAVFPLVMRKAFGRTAGVFALVVGLATLSMMLLLLDLRVVRITIPAMVALGPLMVVQYVFWTRRLGTERTTWQYQQVEASWRRA